MGLLARILKNDNDKTGSVGTIGGVTYDPDTQYAVIRSSICTGEKVAGFKNKKDGQFTEVMLITSKADERLFRDTYHLEDVRVEY